MRDEEDISTPGVIEPAESSASKRSVEEPSVTTQRALSLRDIISVALLVVAGLMVCFDRLALQPMPLWSILGPSAFVGLGALVVAKRWRVRRAAIVLLLLISTLGAMRKHYWSVRETSVAQTEVFNKQLTTLRNKIVSFCQQHPQTAFTSLSEYLEAGALSDDDLVFLRKSEVILYPYLPQGGDSDTLIDVRWGTRRVIVSQAGGIFAYTPETIQLLQSSNYPSPTFLRTLRGVER